MLTTEPSLNPARLKRRGDTRRKRFMVVSVAGLAVLAAALGVSFLGTTGSTAVSVTAANSNFIFPVSNGASLPSGTNFVNALKYTPASAITSSSSASTINTATLPSWAPVLNTAGSVTTAGDLAVVDATTASTGVIVNVYVTNLAGLQMDYSSYALPFNVYSSSCTAGSCGTWAQASGISLTYLTNSEGFLSFSLPAGKYYDITMDTGGSFFTSGTSTTSPASLSPSYYFTAQPF